MFGLLSFDFSGILLSLSILIPILLYRYLTRNNDYWSKQGIKGPKPILLFGNLLDRVKESMAIIDMEYTKKYGNVYGLFDGTVPVLQIGDPELIKQVLVKEFNRFNDRRDLQTYHPIININLFFSRSEQWKRLRTIMSGTFTSGKMKKLYGLVRECIGEYLEHLEEVAAKGKPVNVKDMHENLTMDVIASCAFATKTNAAKDPNNRFVVNLRKFFYFKASRFIPAFLFPKSINKILNVTSIFDPDSNQFIIDLAKHLIEKRLKSGEKNNDFLQLLIDANAEESKKDDITGGLESQYINKDENEGETIFDKKLMVNKTLTEDEVIAQCWVFLLAGFETTATTFGFMSYALAMNPEYQEKLYEELVNAMDEHNEINYDDLHRLPYLDACISETLRFYPPVNRLEREVNENFKLGDSEIRLYKGQLVEITVYAVHHNEKYYENADKFIPERFLPENRHKLIPYTFLPFGTGPRNCIGMRFALMELKLAMAHIITRFRFVRVKETEETLKFRPIGPTLNPYSLTVGLEKR